jgi:hypothetical protein
MLRSPDREVVPQILCEGDRCAQDEAIFEPGSFDNCVRYGSPCGDEATWKALELRFHNAYLGVLAGLRAWDDPELQDSAVQLGLDGPRHHDARPPRTADRVLDDEVLCDAVEDSVPELMMLIERISGVVGMPRRPVVGAVAALAYVYCGIEGTRPLDGWMDDEEDRSLSVRRPGSSTTRRWASGRTGRACCRSCPGGARRRRLFRDFLRCLRRVPIRSSPAVGRVGRSRGWCRSRCRTPKPMSRGLAVR